MDGAGKSDPKITIIRARQLLREKRYADALQTCTDELARGTDDPELRLIAASSLLAQGRQEGAKKEALQVVRLAPDMHEAHRILADVAFSRGELTAAREHLERVLELNPNDEQSTSMLKTLSHGPGIDEEGGPSTRPLPKAIPQQVTEPEEEGSSQEFQALTSEDLLDGAVVEMAADLPLFPSDEQDPSQQGEQSSSDLLQVSDSMMEELPDEEPITVESEGAPPPRGLNTLLDGDNIRAPEEAQARGAMSVEDAWKPAGAPGAAPQQKKGTLRLPALDVLPEEEDAPTMPLLRPTSPPAPQLRLDPKGVKPVSHEKVSDRKKMEVPQVSPASSFTPSLPPDDSAEMNLEPASIPLASGAPRSIPRDVADPIKARQQAGQARKQPSAEIPGLLTAMSGQGDAPDAGQDSEEDTGDLLNMFAGAVPVDGSVPLAPVSAALQPRQPSPAAAPAPGPFGGYPADDSMEIENAFDDEEDEEFSAGDSISRQIKVAAARPPIKHKRSPGKGRWVLVAILGLTIGAGGFAGYLWYQSYTYVQAQWQVMRDGVHQSTPEGYRAARGAAEKIFKKRPKDPQVAAALAMCDAAMSVEFGNDELKAARDFLEKSKGSDSEWRTAANAFLALMDDPARAEGYLIKGLEVYPQSALLHYLQGRALAARGELQKAAKSYQGALKIEPRYIAAHISLAVLQGTAEQGFSDALTTLDEILQKTPDNIQALIERARLRARHNKETDQAATDARRVIEELAKKAGKGQIGWAHLVLAQVARVSHRYMDTVEALKQATESPPCCDSTFRFELAGELMSLHRMSGAQVQMEQALQLKPKQTEYLLRMGRILLELEDPQHAATYLLKAPARHLETRLLLGRLAFSQRKYKKALSLLKLVKLEDPKAVEPAIYHALALARTNQRTEALTTLRKLSADNAGNPEALKALGLVELWGGEYAKADAVFKAAWKLLKLDPAIPTLMGHVSRGLHDLTRAIKRYQRALRILPEYRAAHLGLAGIYIGMGKLTEARGQLGQISKNNLEHAEVVGMTARIQLAEGKMGEAQNSIAKARGAGGSPALISRLSGELALHQKKGAAAVELLRTAAKLTRPKDVELLVFLGQAQLMARKVDDAYDTFHAALRADPGNPRVLLALGRIATKDGEMYMAIKRFNDALAKAKERMRPKTMVASIHTALGEAYLKKADTGRAITNLQDAMDLDPTAAEPQQLMGMTYDRLDRPARAVAFYGKALQLDAGRTAIYKLLGRAYAKAGDPANALKFYQAFLKTNPPAHVSRAVQHQMQKLQN